MQPVLNYSMQPVPPGKSMAETLQLIQTLGQMGDQRDARLANEQAAMAAQAAGAQQAELRAALDAAHSDPTVENRVRLADLYAQYNPEKAKAFRENWEMLDSARQQTTFRDSVSMLSMLESNPEMAISTIEEQIKAAETAGNPEEAKKYKTLLGLIKTGDKGLQAAKDSLYTTIGMIPGGKDAISAMTAAKAAPVDVEKTLADIGYTKAQTNKLLAELEAAKKAGGLDPEKRFASELALNKEYTTRAKAYDESIRLNDVIKTSAASGTGAGDLALINTFMKMLDPGSVVRESEFAQAQDTAGLISKLAASLGRVQSGQVLVPAQREEFARLAGEYMKAAAKNEEKVRAGLEFMVKSYGLDPKNVFGTMADGKPATTASAPSSSTLRDYIKSKWPGEIADIDKLSDSELADKYKKTTAEYQAKQAPKTTATQTTTEVDF